MPLPLSSEYATHKTVKADIRQSMSHIRQSSSRMAHIRQSRLSSEYGTHKTVKAGVACLGVERDKVLLDQNRCPSFFL